MVPEAWMIEESPLEIASVGITNVLELGLRQYFRSRAMKKVLLPQPQSLPH